VPGTTVDRHGWLTPVDVVTGVAATEEKVAA